MPKILIKNGLNAGKAIVNSWAPMFKAGLKLLVPCLIFFQLFVAPSSAADVSNESKLSIATASNFRPVLEQLRAAFFQQINNKEKNYQINISSASSGVIYAQILQGAPFQLFFSANTSFPEKLVASGHGMADTLVTYAIGKLVLVSRNKNNGSGSANPAEILFKAKRIAIANPRTAPYGIAAMEVIESLGVVDESKPKLVVGNNIAQAWQFFHSGNADVAIVAASLMSSPGQAEFKQEGISAIDLSPYLKHPVRQSLVATKPVGQLAQQFLGFMKTPTAKKIIVDGGYLLSPSDDYLTQ